MASANDNDEQMAARSRARKPILVGAINTGRAFSHNIQGPTPPALDFSSFPAAEEAIQVTDEFCGKYRALRKEVEILREENCRLRRMLEGFLAPIMDTPPPTSVNSNSFQTLLQNCQSEKGKLKELLAKRKYEPSSPKE